MRSDLLIAFSHERGRANYVAKDPLTLAYFSLSEVEFQILNCLDGKTSLEQIADQIQARFSGQRLSVSEISEFLKTLIGSHLVTCTTLGHARILARKRLVRQSARTRWLGRLNLISFRWRGVDPNQFLKGLYRRVSWIYSTPCCVLSLLLMLGALGVFLFHALGSGLPAVSLDRIFSAQNVPLLLLSVILVKALHEIGHGLTCVHYGGECHELGFLFIAFCPLPYCDTTDSWLHQNRWQRAHVAAAGISVELLIASLCCLLWAISVPGLLNLMLLNLVLICSLNTLLVNGNPLLRYDGYYVLSDVLNYPNLGPEARQMARSWFERIVFGRKLEPDEQVSWRRLPLVGYGLASTLYRLFVMVMILWAVHQLLKRFGLDSLTILIALPMLTGMFLSTAFSILRSGRAIMQQSSGTGVTRAMVGTSASLLVLLLLLLIPLPNTVYAPLTLEPGSCQPVYVTVPGRLSGFSDSLSRLESGDSIAQLDNPHALLAVAEAEADITARRLHLENLQKFRSVSPGASSALPAAEQALKVAAERLAVEQQRLARLNIVSPRDGEFFPPRNLPLQAQREAVVRTWSEYPLRRENLSAWLPAQTLLGWVGSVDNFEVVAYVPQHQLEYVRLGASARIVFLSAATDTCLGEVIGIGNEAVREAPRELFQQRLLTADPLAGQFHPSETLYRVRIRSTAGTLAPLYASGIVRIEGPPLSLLHRGWRAIAHAFALDL